MKLKPHRLLIYLLALYCFILFLYAVFSYSLTDPNLVLLKWDLYWQWQQWMWQTFFKNRQLLTTTYTLLVSALWFSYCWLLKAFFHQPDETNKVTLSKVIGPFLLLLIPVFVAYNALSHDVFNYAFNAKMVVVYEANPHLKVALDFADDPWTRFMHNTHTTAPYGYGWTLFSILPLAVSFNSFFLTWLGFKGLSVLSYVCTAGLLVTLLRQRQWTAKPLYALALFLANPLVLLEIIGNAHNDLWMMVPALASLVIVSRKKLSLDLVITGLILLGLSISIKYATVVLIPVWLLLVSRDFVNGVWHRYSDLVLKWWPLLASVLLFIPLLTARSQYFHPWYLTWSLVFIPILPLFEGKKMVKLSWIWIGWLLTLSLTSLWRYIPWLWAGGFENGVLQQQQWTTWGLAVLIYGLGSGVFLLLKARSSSRFTLQ